MCCLNQTFYFERKMLNKNQQCRELLHCWELIYAGSQDTLEDRLSFHTGFQVNSRNTYPPEAQFDHGCLTSFQ